MLLKNDDSYHVASSTLDSQIGMLHSKYVTSSAPYQERRLEVNLIRKRGPFGRQLNSVYDKISLANLPKYSHIIPTSYQYQIERPKS